MSNTQAPTEPNSRQTQAAALLAAVHRSPSTYIPRRLVIVDWLDEFLSRARRKDFVITETEGSDLLALEHFLRTCELPAISTGNS